MKHFNQLEAIKQELTNCVEVRAKLGVKIAMLKNDLEDTQEGMAEDQAFLRDLQKNCAAKKAEWELYKKMQAGDKDYKGARNIDELKGKPQGNHRAI